MLSYTSPRLPIGSPSFALLAFLFALLIGFQFRLSTVLGTEVDGPLRADAGQYVAYAYNLVHHGVYSNDLRGIVSPAAPAPDDLRNPGYCLLLLPFIGSSPTAASLLKITIFQAFLSTGVIFLIYLAARQTMSGAGPVAVAFLAALSPHLINANVYILTETAASFSTVLFLFVLIYFGKNSERTGVTGWLECGALLGVATLIRPTMQWFLIPTLFLIYRLPTTDKRPSLIGALAGFTVVMSPWWIRNFLQFGEMSNSSLMINSLHHGLYPGFLFAERPETFGFPYRFDPRTAEITSSLHSVLAEIARRFRDQPIEHLEWFLLGKPLMFWNWDNSAQGAGDVFIYPVTKTPFITNLPLFAAHEAMRWLHWPLVALGMAGSLLCWLPVTTRILGEKAAWAYRVCGTLLIYFLLLHMVVAPFPRYSIPILPILYLQAIVMLTVTYRYFRQPRS